jgi:hypothetical protein
MNPLAIFDAANEASRVLHEADQRRRDVEAARPRCGKCRHWMKSSACPMERNVNGYTRGPSRNGTVCGKYLQSV